MLFRSSETRHYFPGFKQDDVYYTMAGLRPLVAAEKRVESNTSRAHKLIDHEQRDGIKGFVSVLGGKITAYRAVAEEALDLICRKLGRQVRCSTASTPLPGAPAPQMSTLEQAARSSGLPVATLTHLASIYGSRFSAVLDYVREDQRLGQPVSSCCRDILAQIKHSVIEEEALTIGDFLLRRGTTGFMSSQGLDAVETVAREMAALLEWSDRERQNQIAAYRASANLGRRFTKQANDVSPLEI